MAQTPIASRIGALSSLVLLVAGCSDQRDAAISKEYELIQAQYTECAEQGQEIAKYLDTGKPIRFDPNHGDKRKEVLKLEGEQRALTIRRYAAQVIQACDYNRAQAEAASRSRAAGLEASRSRAAAEAEASRSRAATHRAAEQRFIEVCEEFGGTVDKGEIPVSGWSEGPNRWGCAIEYPECNVATAESSESCKRNPTSQGTFYIPLDYDANLLPNNFSRQVCRSHQKDGWGDWWHEDTHVCAIS